jgi:hypothetical protein
VAVDVENAKISTTPPVVESYGRLTYERARSPDIVRRNPMTSLQCLPCYPDTFREDDVRGVRKKRINGRPEACQKLENFLCHGHLRF